MWYSQGIKAALAAQELSSASSDRVVAVIGGALVDHNVTLALKDRFIEDIGSDGPVKRMLKETGPLGATANKITMLRLLDAINEEAEGALHALAKIRNIFAHNLEIKFDSDNGKLKEASKKLVLGNGLKYYSEIAPNLYSSDNLLAEILIPPMSNIRDRFVVNVKLSTILLASKRLRSGGWESAV